MTLKYVAEIRDPIHGYIKITKEERELIDSIFVQRLRRIHQLAGAYLVYPGGVHSRFEHVIGTMHVAGLIGQSVAGKAGLRDDDIQELRIAALLHDVGHGPFSHLFEEVLSEKSDLSHEDVSQRIVSESEIADVLRRNGYQPSKMSNLCVGKSKGQPFLNQVIAGGLSADMMDYLPRDSYFTGVEYGKVDVQRVVDSLHVADGHLVIDDAALCAFEGLVQRRDRMVGRLFADEKARKRAAYGLSKSAATDPTHIYLDVPTTPSVPDTYSKEALTSVRLFRAEGKKKVMKEVPLGELPLLGSIAGFMDMLRVYTTPEKRQAV